mmetsp:Transcript_25538/g.59233  ORF Transcript_25538/g.59233 Transcript_25538/m.59233 type:complete len:212 (-) Transcript_25538:23-658(-)
MCCCRHTTAAAARTTAGRSPRIAAVRTCCHMSPDTCRPHRTSCPAPSPSEGPAPALSWVRGLHRQMKRHRNSQHSRNQSRLQRQEQRLWCCYSTPPPTLQAPRIPRQMQECQSCRGPGTQRSGHRWSTAARSLRCRRKRSRHRCCTLPRRSLSAAVHMQRHRTMSPVRTTTTDCSFPRRILKQNWSLRSLPHSSLLLHSSLRSSSSLSLTR